MSTSSSAPTSLTATMVSSTEIDLSWNASSGATSYSLQRSTRQGGPYTKIASVSGATTTYDNTSLAPSTTYYYVVAAINAGGTGPNSSEASATTAPSAPSGVHAKANGANEIDLTWTAVKGAGSYIIESSTTEGGPYSQVGTSSWAGYRTTRA